MARPRIDAHIQVEGLRELQDGLRNAKGKLPTELGIAHRDVGKFIISRLPAGDPQAVGAGPGAKVRASSTKREVLLRVGYPQRGGRKAQWGRELVQPFISGRPYIIQTVKVHEPEIVDYFMERVMQLVETVSAN